MPRLYCRDGLLVLGFILFVPFTWIVIFSGTGLNRSGEDQKLAQEKLKLENEVKDMKEHMSFLETLGNRREQEAIGMKKKFYGLIQNISLSHNRTHAVQLMLNFSAISNVDVVPPSIFDHLPYLKAHTANALTPSFKMSRARNSVSVVIGVPSVKREKKSYLFETLKSLTDNLNVNEREDCLIVVFLAEPNDQAFVHSTALDINKHFSRHIESGLLEIIAPSSHFYPNFKSIQPNLGDTKDRTIWRTKQNLDFCYLMMYCRTRGRYYVQLEDDVISKPGYHSTMKSFALNQKNPNWFLLEFSQLGFIGKMFKSTDLPYLIQFLAMFHIYKPCDWLVDHFLWTRVCRFDKDLKHCRRSVSEIRVRYKPSLFQHIGIHSSLKGKIQKLKDKDYGKVQLHRPHSNPAALVKTNLQVYQKYDIARAYKGETFFWATLPKAGDEVTIEFTPPVSLQRLYFRCGTIEHEDDQFYNTTVEIKPLSLDNIPADLSAELAANKTSDAFFIVSKFQDGEANAFISPKIGKLHSVRLKVQMPSDKWIILSEIFLKPR